MIRSWKIRRQERAPSGASRTDCTPARPASTHFHQDWDLDAADWQAIVRLYGRDGSPQEAAATADELERLLTQTESDPPLADRLLRESSCYYDPRPDLGGPTHREWLSQVAGMLRQQNDSP